MAMTKDATIRRVLLSGALSALATTGLPRLAVAQGYSVLRTFPFGEGPGSLGFREGDTSNEVARLVSVDDHGWSYIADDVNGRTAIVRGSNVTFYDHDAAEFVVEVLGLAGSRFVVDRKGVFRTIDANGVVQAEGQRTGRLFLALPTGNFIVEQTRRHPPYTYLEYTPGLEVVAQREAADFLPTTVQLGGSVVIRFQGECWIVPREVRPDGNDMFRADDRLLYFASVGLLEARRGGRATRFTVREDEYRDRFTIPDVLAVDGENLVSVWRKASEALGLDGRFYALVQTPDHYELVRWDLDALPKEEFPAITNTPPTIVFDGPTTAVAGSELRVWVVGKDTQPELFRFSATNLPDGARLHTGAAADLAAFVWTPSAEQVGEHAINITVEDSMCGKSTQTLKITVEPAE